MTTANWTANEVPTDTNYNEMVNDVSESLLYVATPADSLFKGQASVTWKRVATLTLRPVQGDYLCFRFQARGTGGTGKFLIEVQRSGVIDTLYTVTTVPSGATWVDYDSAVLMTGLTLNGDVTGLDADIVIYLNDKCEVRLLHIYSGTSSSVADYGGA